jgi:hypothetical protein
MDLQQMAYNMTCLHVPPSKIANHLKHLNLTENQKLKWILWRVVS